MRSPRSTIRAGAWAAGALAVAVACGGTTRTEGAQNDGSSAGGVETLGAGGRRSTPNLGAGGRVQAATGGRPPVSPGGAAGWIAAGPGGNPSGYADAGTGGAASIPFDASTDATRDAPAQESGSHFDAEPPGDSSVDAGAPCDATLCLAAHARAAPLYDSAGYILRLCCVRPRVCGFTSCPPRGSCQCIDVPDMFRDDAPGVPIDDAGRIPLDDGGTIVLDDTCPSMPYPWGTYEFPGCCLPDAHCGLSTHTLPWSDAQGQLSCAPYSSFPAGYPIPAGDPTCVR